MYCFSGAYLQLLKLLTVGFAMRSSKATEKWLHLLPCLFVCSFARWFVRFLLFLLCCCCCCWHLVVLLTCFFCSTIPTYLEAPVLPVSWIFWCRPMIFGLVPGNVIGDATPRYEIYGRQAFSSKQGPRSVPRMVGRWVPPVRPGL